MSIQIDTINIIDHDAIEKTNTLTIRAEGNEIIILGKSWDQTRFDTKYLGDLIHALTLIKQEHN